MVTPNMASNMPVDKELVHQDMAKMDNVQYDPVLDGAIVSNDDLRDAVFEAEDLGSFSSIDDLEDFLRTFEASDDPEATVSTQDEGDLAGDPVDTVH